MLRKIKEDLKDGEIFIVHRSEDSILLTFFIVMKNEHNEVVINLTKYLSMQNAVSILHWKILLLYLWMQQNKLHGLDIQQM